MPALSSTMTEGKIVSWVKTEGNKLAKGESVLVVESDKVDIDVESFYDGYLATIIVPEGGSASVGSTIALLAESEDEISLAKAKIPTSTSSSSQETTTPTAAVTEEVVSLVATVAGVSPSHAGPAKIWKETIYPQKNKTIKEQGNR
ncbi:PDC-E2 5-like protein [Nicotiana attenuata]|uniref:PDC-E2 5-like protein n=1 Tax=Nicotiana attenuata TaxID=49451 RepID=A0A1J6J8K0_NICAT|nr:PDC-E2 5-like protein [Nicotiana attenuata]